MASVRAVSDTVWARKKMGGMENYDFFYVLLFYVNDNDNYNDCGGWKEQD